MGSFGRVGFEHSLPRGGRRSPTPFHPFDLPGLLRASRFPSRRPAGRIAKLGAVELLVRLDPWDRGSYGPHMRQVLIHPGEDGYWVAECPSLPGCVSQGSTREEAIRNVKEAMEGYVLALQEDGLPVPEERFDALLLAV